MNKKPPMHVSVISLTCIKEQHSCGKQVYRSAYEVLLSDGRTIAFEHDRTSEYLWYKEYDDVMHVSGHAAVPHVRSPQDAAQFISNMVNRGMDIVQCEST